MLTSPHRPERVPSTSAHLEGATQVSLVLGRLGGREFPRNKLGFRGGDVVRTGNTPTVHCCIHAEARRLHRLIEGTR